MNTTIKIKSSWYVVGPEGNVIAQPFKNKARAEFNASERNRWAAEADARDAEQAATRLADAKAYLSIRAARADTGQMGFGF